MELDLSVLKGLRAGDARALADCYSVFGARVQRLCRGMLNHESDAEDATQEVFLKILDRAHQFEERSRFSTWLHRLTVNHCLHRLERERARRTDALHEDLVDRAPSPPELAARAEARRRLDALLARLPDHHRAALVLREVEGLSYSEIAAVLSVPEGTVMSRIARALVRTTRR